MATEEEEEEGEVEEEEEERKDEDNEVAIDLARESLAQADHRFVSRTAITSYVSISTGHGKSLARPSRCR